MTYAYRGDGGTIPSLSIIVQFDNTGFHYAGWRPNSAPGARYVTWIALGIQQWGSIYIPSDTRIQVSFPITYNSIPCAIALSNQGEKNTDYAAAYSDLTQSSVYLADNKDTVHFIVLGT